MKIYTKKGDKGKTSLLSGKIVPKHHIRIDAYGTIDELVSYCGLLRDSINNKYYENLFVDIQDRLMTIASVLSAENHANNLQLPQLKEDDIITLEKEIDKIEEQLPPLSSFIIPGGNTVVSFCHITRTISRRAERIVTKLSEECEVNSLILKYLNRLSDFLFVLSRLISRDLNAKEISWKPKL